MNNSVLKFTTETSLAGISGVASRLLPFLGVPALVFLEGELGAGKTTFVSALVNLLNPGASASSPTFSLMTSIPLSSSSATSTPFSKVLHMDLYRLDSYTELGFLGFELEFELKTLCFVEWGLQFSGQEWRQIFLQNGILRPASVHCLSITNSPSMGKEECSSVLRQYSLVELPEFFR